MKSDYVFVLDCFILIGCNCISARFRVLPQKSPVVVAVGDIAVLACQASIFNELKEVRWIRSQGGHRYILNIIKDGRDQQECELPEYVGRMEVIKEDLTSGGVGLKLFNVSVSDEGVYRCYLETVYYFDFGDLDLTVTALGSDPTINIEGFQDDNRKAVCRSAGWYPEPVLVNKDDDGEMKMQKEENGLYSIEYSRFITENANRTFSCKLRCRVSNQEKETSLYLADDLFRKRNKYTSVIFVIPTTTAAAAFLTAFVILRIRQAQKQAHHPEVIVECTPLHLSEGASSAEKHQEVCVPLEQDLSLCVLKQSEGLLSLRSCVSFD